MNISVERRRGCGYRKPGGIYLVAPGTGFGCGLLPIPLTICPCCGAGFRHNRGFTWINPAGIAAAANHACTRPTGCSICPLADSKVQRAGLLWIGAAFYKTPDLFDAEAARMGISRRISALPRDFKVGESWIALAHIKAIEGPAPAPGEELIEARPGIFRLFKPTAIEYVVKGTETDEELARFEKRGFTLVKVVHAKEEQEAA